MSALVLDEDATPKQLAAAQARLVAASVGREVVAFAPHWHARFATAGLSPKQVKGFNELGRVAPSSLADLDGPEGIVLRPTGEALRKHGPRPLARRMRRFRLSGRGGAVSKRLVDPVYKPIRWWLEGDVPFGMTETDLDMLGELGRRWLAAAGLSRTDAIVALAPRSASLAFWQLAVGARDAAVPFAALDAAAGPASVSLLGPTVLAGSSADLLALVRVGAPNEPPLRTIIVLGEVASGATVAELATLVPGAEVVSAWAPPGVRALWGQCRGGVGLHTWPQTEIVEVLDDEGRALPAGVVGRVVWTGLGWRGSAFVRLDTGARAAVAAEGKCPSCGRWSARLLVSSDVGRAPAVPGRVTAAGELPGVAASAPVPAIQEEAQAAARGPAQWAASDEDAAVAGCAGVQDWHLVWRERDGLEEVVVYLALVAGTDLTSVLEELDPVVGAAQYVILGPDAVAAHRARDAQLAGI